MSERGPARLEREGWLAAAARVSLRGLLVGAAVVAVLYVASRLRLVLIPLGLAVLVSTALSPLAARLRRHGLPRGAAAALALLTGVALLAALVSLVVPAVVGEIDDLGDRAREGLDEAARWLTTGPLGFSEAEVDRAVDDAIDEIRDESGVIAGGVIGGLTRAAEIATGLVLALFMTFFLLRDGGRIWAWLLDWLPPLRREEWREVGERCWLALGGYVRGVCAVAIVDAVAIGLALLLIGVPLVLPLMVLTFLAAFVPFVGAITAGAVAALVALVSEGPLAAAFVVLAVTLVQQLEGNLLYPLIVGHAVQVHPLAILLAVVTGGVLAGVLGAVFAVPVATVAWTAIAHVREVRSEERLAPIAQPDRATPS